MYRQIICEYTTRDTPRGTIIAIGHTEGEAMLRQCALCTKVYDVLDDAHFFCPNCGKGQLTSDMNPSTKDKENKVWSCFWHYWMREAAPEIREILEEHYGKDERRNSS
jgi:predicted RNA-binding Zn-ribbon protein involved in translation (DUF1610 family)